MTLWKTYTTAVLLLAAVTPRPEAKTLPDVLGWEQARWGMDSDELKRVFASKVLVPLRADRKGEDLFVIPGYVFLGCPFDVELHVNMTVGLSGIELTQVSLLVGHSGNDAQVYRTACAAVASRLADQLGPAQDGESAKSWYFPSTEITASELPEQVHVTFIRRNAPS